MTTYSFNGLEWERGLTPRRNLLMQIVRRLDEEEIEQFRFSEDTCHTCGEPFYGILDEGKLRQPLPKQLGGKGLLEFYFPEGGLGFNAYWFHPSTGEQVRGRMTDYEICQSIVRSGLFSREQLGLSKLTQHELEVCERTFADVRPLRCGCDFGSPKSFEVDDFLSMSGKYGDLVEVDGLTAIEKSFVTGKPVRTGYRRRSLEKVRERRIRYRQRHQKLHVSGVVPKPLEGFSMQDVNPAPIKLVFQFKPYGRHSRPYKRAAQEIRSIRSEVKVQKSVHKTVHYRLDRNLVVRPKIDPEPPAPDQAKYWYFRRKRGFYYHSLHHPLKGDIVPKGTVRDYSKPG